MFELLYFISFLSVEYNKWRTNKSIFSQQIRLPVV